MSCRDIAKPSQQESSGDNVYDKLRKRLLRHSLVEKSQHYSQVNHLVKNSPQFPRYCFSSRMGWWSEPSLPLIRPSSMTLRRHSLISLSGERDYGERDRWVERVTRTVCETIQSVFPKTLTCLEPRPLSSARQLVVPFAVRQNTTC